MISGIVGGLLNMFGPIVLWGLKKYVEYVNMTEEQKRNYYEFLADLDKNTKIDVTTYMAAGNAREATIKRIIEDRKMATGGDEPERLESHLVHKYEMPKIVEIDVKMKTHGRYKTRSGQARGVIVHFTAGRFDKGKDSAIATLRYLASKGLGCLVMDTDGVIYKAKNQDWNEVAYHAGKSSWRGKSGISQYCFGMEICNAGKLENNLKSWFGQQISKKDARQVNDGANRKAGWYHKFTEAQEKSLMDFIMWQFETNPEFSIDWIVGHDEVAPKRKSDPGGSLSCTMPEFRQKVLDAIKASK